MIRLNDSGVLFDSGTHTYTLDGKELQGVTPIVAWMFPDTYQDIPSSVLQSAAERGSAIHAQCEMADNLGVEPTLQEAKDYLELRQDNGFEPAASEYLVTDGKNIASAIDKVFLKKRNNIILSDIKTTSKLHVSNVTLQLSIYAYLFELQNPHLHVYDLNAIWLPKPQYGASSVWEIPRLTADACKEIITAYLNGEDSAPLRAKYFPEVAPAATQNMPAEIKDAEQSIIDCASELAKLQDKYKLLQEGLLDLMREHDIKKYETDRIVMTRVLPSKRTSFDSKKFQAEHPELYSQYIQESATKESIRIKIK